MTRLRRTTARLLAAAVVCGSTFGASATPAGADASGVTKTRSVTRDYLVGGQRKVVDKRTVTLHVDTTTNLRSLQQIHVTWSGARPTQGIVPDVNSDLAQNEEFSFALFECRGVDSPSAPAATRLTPQTCWTNFADERFRYYYSGDPAWRADSYAGPADRAAVVGKPTGQLPKQCTNLLLGSAAQHWLPFVAADGTAYEGGPDGCDGLPPEASPENLSSLSLPSNETFGITTAEGTGEANFDVFTAEDHASLGCSQSVPCSLVAVPMEGISCDDTAPSAPAVCETDGNFKPGQILSNVAQSGAEAVDGALWWAPSNWRNRISVPLSFAPADNICSLTGSQTPIDVYGSELMTQAATSWAPHFCLDKSLFAFKHVQTPEPQARNLLNDGNVQAAFISDVPDGGYSRPVVSAPVAVTGFGIAFAVDDGNQRPVQQLRLNARLLAKLMTESYPDQPFVRSAYPAGADGTTTLSTNPLNLAADPEFQALNPGVPPTVSDGAATLLLVNTDSDVIHALTAYIDADADARAWLDGTADPWGMRVNPNYRKISLPVDNWPLLDSFEPTAVYQPGKNDCLAAAPVPYLPLVSAPTARLFSIAQDMEFALGQSQTVCSLPSPIPGDTAGAKMVATGRQQPGHRFMLGLVSLGDAARYGLQVASLQTKAGAFAPATATSLKAAASTLKQDRTTGIWAVDHKTLLDTPAAYPGTMLVYASIPTKGLTSSTAGNLATLLRYAASDGQTPGAAQGQLPDGYLPMTTANGFGDMVTYTRTAALAVEQQQGAQPPLAGVNAAGAPSPANAPAAPAERPSGSTASFAASGGSTAVGSPSVPETSPFVPSAGASVHGAARAQRPVVAPQEAVHAVGVTASLSTGIAGSLLPLLLLVAIACTAGAPLLIRLAGRSRS